MDSDFYWLFANKNEKLCNLNRNIFVTFSGVVLVVFGILVLVHGAALGGTGAGLWAGASALVSGALGVVATLANKSSSGFSTAHLASSLVALALSNMSAITALASIVRDSQRSEFTLLAVPVSFQHNSRHTVTGLPFSCSFAKLLLFLSPNT